MIIVVIKPGTSFLRATEANLVSSAYDIVMHGPVLYTIVCFKLYILFIVWADPAFSQKYVQYDKAWSKNALSNLHWIINRKGLQKIIIIIIIKCAWTIF